MSAFELVLFGRLLYNLNVQPSVFSREALKHLVNVKQDFSINLYIHLILLNFGARVFRFSIVLGHRSRGSSTWNNGMNLVVKMGFNPHKSSSNWRKLYDNR